MSPMNNRRMVPTQEPGILDFAPGAAAAYSLRNLSLSYVGPVVTVRRSTDDVEADFTASEVSDGTLAAWCSGGDGFVKTWHDQSGNGNDASQGTAANQPQIVDSGTLITEGGKATLRFGSLATIDSGLDSSALDIPVSVFMLLRITQDSSNVYGDVTFYFSGDALAPSLGKYELKASPDTDTIVATYRTDSGSTSNSAGTAYNNTSMYLHSAIFGVDAFIASVNGAVNSEGGLVDNDYTASNKITIGVNGVTGNGTFTCPECIIYPTDMTALRTRIEGSLAWTFNA